MEDNRESVILIKFIKDHNIGMGTVFSILEDKGFTIQRTPMFKLSPQMQDVLIETLGKTRQLNPAPIPLTSTFLKNLKPVSKHFTHLGHITKFLDEKGYGFVREANIPHQEFNKLADLFFHIKTVFSQPEVGKLYAFNLLASKKHVDKLEAISLTVPADISDISVLFELYLKYRSTPVLEQILILCNQRDLVTLEAQFQDTLNRLILPVNDTTRARLIPEFYKILNLVRGFEEQFKQQLTYQLLDSGRKDTSLVLLYGNRFLKEIDLNARKSEIQQLYYSLDQESRSTVLPLLNPLTRLLVSELSKVETEEQLRKLMALMDLADENKQANFSAIEEHLQLNTRSKFLLWIYDFTVHQPELHSEEIKNLDDSSTIRMLGKLNADRFVQIFPYSNIDSQKSFDLLGLYLSASSAPENLLKALLGKGLGFSDTYYIKALLANNDLPLDTPRLKNLVSKSDISEYSNLIYKLGWRDSVIVFEEAIKYNQLICLRQILKCAGDFLKSQIGELHKLNRLSVNTAIELWYEGLAEMLHQDIFALYFLLLDESASSDRIFERVEDKRDFLQRAFHAFASKEKANTTLAAKRLLGKLQTYDAANFDKYLTKILQKSNPRTHLELWLEDYHLEFDFDRYKIYFIALGKQDQINFLKKSIWQLRNGTAEFRLSQLFELRNLTIDPKTAAQAEHPTKVDISIYIVIQLLQDLQVGALTQPEKIYQVIADNISDARQLLFIGGFFDQCEGRLTFDYKAEVEEGDHYPLNEKRGQVPQHLIYCEGRRAKIKGSQTLSVCELTGKEFWWCRNIKCYANCINEHNLWQDFTILDFCDTLGIPISQDDYETLLGYINKINRYLEHMNCRSCKSILRPQGHGTSSSNTNYGFYRVSNFACLDPDCDQHGKVIYLSHCTNGSCAGIIDQRDSVKCIPGQSSDKKSGWYICNDCLACCNTKNIDKRIYILNHTGQQYHGHHQGHLDLGLICCPRSGHELQRSGMGSQDYKRILEWLISNRDKSPGIIKYGQRQTDGRYWFILKAESQQPKDMDTFKEKLRRYISYGFNVPDLETDRTSYMLSEPFLGQVNSMLFTCPSCDYSLDLSEDYEQLARMRNYHKHLNISRQYS